MSVAWARWQCCREAEESLRVAHDARAVIVQLAGADPQNREWYRDTGESDFWIGKIQAAAGQRSQARISLERALRVYGDILSANPSDGETKAFLSRRFYLKIPSVANIGIRTAGEDSG